MCIHYVTSKVHMLFYQRQSYLHSTANQPPSFHNLRNEREEKSWFIFSSLLKDQPDFGNLLCNPALLYDLPFTSTIYILHLHPRRRRRKCKRIVAWDRRVVVLGLVFKGSTLFFLPSYAFLRVVNGNKFQI